MTNYFWMFVEGLFLHTLVVFALKIDADRINFWIYCAIGWGKWNIIYTFIGVYHETQIWHLYFCQHTYEF